MDTEYIVVLITAKDYDEAEKIGQELLKEKLIACVNITRGIRSLFWWEEKIDEAEEALMVVKTRKNFFEKIVETVKVIHSYAVPEIIALPIIAGQEDYLKWIDESLE